METTMGPPLLPGYSLRVMLFRANACSEGDRPMRCFRVVTSPDVTVRDFCQEASRIHEINYGEPIAIKKVQDDQEFDVTQGELLGSLFKNLDTIRVIQAASHPGVRDSLPPTSALRFDPGTSRKREREKSARPNGSAQSNSWNPNKRQRVSDLDPDQPLPSREIETNGRRPSLNVIPDSQDSVISGASNGVRHVRKSLPRRIPETPSPPPSSHKSTSENGFADHRDDQSDIQSSNGDANLHTRSDRSTPLRDATQRTQSHTSNPPRAKSASYHIPRPNERGASVSTAATSPLSMDHQLPAHNSSAVALKRKREEPILPPHANRVNRSPNENSIYENITSDDEGPALLKAKKAILKQKSSPGAGLPGLDSANKKFNTPPQGTHRSSGSREPATTPGELPLTPRSKEREEERLQIIKNARKAGMATGEAAERRKREADEARQAEETRVAAEERSKREDQERVEVEEFNRGEVERKAAVAKAARLQKEREDREKKETEEQKREDLARVAKENLNQERLEKGKAAAAETRRLHDLEQGRETKAAEAEKLKKAQEEASRIRLPSSSPAEARSPVSSSPILPRGTPSSRAHSGTPFIPPRKSALKNVMSSQAMRSSSPAGPSRSPEAHSNGVGIETQMPLPKPNRRVSFKKEVEHSESPILPPTRILPPSRIYTSAPPAITPKKPTATPVAKTPIIKTKSQSPSTSILPPKRPSLERSITLIAASKVATPAKVFPVPKGLSPAAVTKKLSPSASQVRRGQTPVRPPISKERSKSSSVEPTKPKPSPTVEPPSEDSDSDERVIQKASAEFSLKPRSAVKKPSQNAGEAEESESSDDEDEEHAGKQEVDEDETQSQNSSTRDSHSPVSFIQHPKSSELFEPVRAATPQSDTSSEDEEMQDAGDEDDNLAVKDRTQASTTEPAKEENSDSDSDSDSESSDSDSENDGKTKVQVPQSSSPVLPAHRPTAKPLDTKLSQAKNSKGPFRDGRLSTQDQVDHQLTSSMYEVCSSLPVGSTPTPVPASSTGTRPPQIKFGASLSSLHQNKLALSASSQLKPAIARNGQLPPKLGLANEDEDSESDESDSDGSSSSSGDDDDKAPAVKPPVRPTSWATSKKVEPSQTEDSDSDGSDDDDEAEKRRAGKELAAQVVAMASSQGSAVIRSPKVYNLSTQPASPPKAKQKSAEKKRDKYTSGYVFSQVR